jgi:predicted PurR-regulated permease PerM
MVVEISRRTILFMAGFVGLLWFVYSIKEIIVLVFISTLLMIGFSPVVNYLVKLKISRILSISIVYFVLIGVMVSLIPLIAIPLIKEAANLTINLPATIQRIFSNTSLVQPVDLQEQLKNITQGTFNFITATTGNFIALLFVLVVTFYLLTKEDYLGHLVTQLFGNKEKRITKTVREIEDKLGAWFRGQLLLCLIIGILSYIVLVLLGIPYALSLAVLTGIMEALPYIGAIIAYVPAILVALTISPTHALLVGIAYLAIQQVQNSFIIPQVMKKAVGLNPLITILAVIVGGSLFGIAGTLLAIPITIIFQTIIQFREKASN